LALGSQTIGSVIRPAAFCGIVGFKATLHRIPTPGLVYFSRTVDHVGLFTQDMRGMALAAAVLCQDWQTIPEPVSLPILGVPRGPYLEQAAPDGLNAFERHLSKLERLGFTIKDVPTLSDIDQLNRLHRRMIFAEFAREHSKIYPKHAARYRPRTAEIVEIGKKVSEDDFATARANCVLLRSKLETQMSQAGVDLWVCPSAPGPAPSGIHNTGDPNMNLPWTHAGMPVITLPAGRAENGLPLGLQFVGSFGADEHLVKWGQVLIDRTGDTLSE
jgi:Asp-tRNA(Asn)/Glu-tRNA(Gln) amidotransferase A subunit family amidase